MTTKGSVKELPCFIEKLQKILRKHLNHEKKIAKVQEHYNFIKKSSVFEWFKQLDAGVISMGRKSDDDFLKGFGHYERIPIDRFYPPFLIRTGLLYDYIEKYKVDPALFMGNLANAKAYNAYRTLVTTLSKDCLQGIIVGDFELTEKPGIVDLYIWKHCASSDKANDICGNIPKCSDCVILRYCHYGTLQRK